MKNLSIPAHNFPPSKVIQNYFTLNLFIDISHFLFIPIYTFLYELSLQSYTFLDELPNVLPIL